MYACMYIHETTFVIANCIITDCLHNNSYKVFVYI